MSNLTFISRKHMRITEQISQVFWIISYQNKKILEENITSDFKFAIKILIESNFCNTASAALKCTGNCIIESKNIFSTNTVVQHILSSIKIFPMEVKLV